MKIGDLVYSYRYMDDDLGMVVSEPYMVGEQEYIDIIFQENGLQQEHVDGCSTDMEGMISYFREREEFKNESR